MIIKNIRFQIPFQYISETLSIHATLFTLILRTLYAFAPLPLSDIYSYLLSPPIRMLRGTENEPTNYPQTPTIWQKMQVL